MLSFDGVDDYVEVPDAPSLSALNKFTISVWMYLRNVPEGCFGVSIVGKGIGGSTCEWLIMVREANDKVWVQITEDSTDTVNNIDGNTPIPRNAWTHVTVVYDGDATTCRIYLNSELDAEKTDLTPITVEDTSYPIHIARRNVYYLDAIIASVCIYNRTLTEDEVKWNYMHSEDPVRDGLVLCLKMNEGYGDTVYDLSGNNNHGTIYGASWVWNTAPSGLSPLLTEYPSLNTYSLRIGGTEVITKDRDIYANKIYGTVGSRELLSNPLRGLDDLKNVEFREDGIPIEKSFPEGVKTPENEEMVNLSHVIGWLMQCVKELSDKVEYLEQCIQAMESGGGS